MFKNRTKEINILEHLYKEKKAKLIILYGRRRVGKTELLNEFARRHKALYLLARQESVKDQLNKISEEIAEFFNDDVLKLNPFQNYDALFSYLAKKDTPIFFDEFPFLVESNKSLPSILQEYWDKHFSKKSSFIVLCGSSIRMMESLLGYKSPIYGRRTEQILLEPLKFVDACQFFPRLSPDDKVINYAILGGTPAYLLEFDYDKPLITNLKEKMLAKNNFLYRDTLFVMQQELNEPRTYYSIIKSVAKGNTRIGNMTNDTGIEKGKITKYLSVLQDLQLIERKIPITEKDREKSRKGIYVLKDNYFKFWFRFVFGNDDYIEQNMQDKLIAEKIKPELNSFVGRAYEEIALEWIKEKKQFSNYLFGRWWNKEEEIDIVGIDRSNKRIIFGEVKWKDLNKNQVVELIGKLKKKSELVEWNDNAKKIFIIAAKKISSKKELIREGYLVFDLEDIVGK